MRYRGGGHLPCVQTILQKPLLQRDGGRQGIGLGLPLAKSIVEGQDGILSVSSTPGEGTVFTITFLSNL